MTVFVDAIWPKDAYLVYSKRPWSRTSMLLANVVTSAKLGLLEQNFPFLFYFIMIFFFFLIWESLLLPTSGLLTCKGILFIFKLYSTFSCSGLPSFLHWSLWLFHIQEQINSPGFIPALNVWFGSFTVRCFLCLCLSHLFFWFCHFEMNSTAERNPHTHTHCFNTLYILDCFPQTPTFVCRKR